MKQLDGLYKRVVDWNTKAGVKDHEYDTLDWHKAIELQTKLLVEEATETMEAAQYGDEKELLDGTADVFVIFAKLADMLEKAGFDVHGAIDEVMGNNDLKVFDSFYLACEEKEKLEARDDVEYTIETSGLGGDYFYTIRRYDNKIMKAINHPKVNLEKFLPQGG